MIRLRSLNAVIRRHPFVVVFLGSAVVVAGLYLAVIAGTGWTTSSGVVVVIAIVALIALLGALWKVHGTLDVVWASDESFANPAPERTPSDYSLSSEAFAADLQWAGERAREGTVEDGIAVVRPLLRDTLSDALVQGGWSYEEVQRALDEGTWTDDRIAASVLATDVLPPERSLRERVQSWLFPEKVMRRRVQRATQTVAETADEALPTVPGQDAPRTVPVVRPRLEDLRRSVDGSLQRAADPLSVARGPRPVEYGLTADEREGESETSDEGGPEIDGKKEADANERDTRSETEPNRHVSVRQRRWRGAIAATAFLAAIGLAGQHGVLLLAAVLPLAYVAVGSLTRTEPPEELSATRSIESDLVPPGQPVTVTLTVRNESSRTVPDVRVADGVPEELAVLDGTPRAGAMLEPGDTHTIRYLVVARHGEYEFDPPQLRVRGLGAGVVVTTTLPTNGDQSLSCQLDADAPPIDERGDRPGGQLTTNRPGEGIAFHSVREYHPDDPANRIDWRHYAKRKLPATVDYERSVAATVVLVVDARPSNRVVAGPGQPTAVEFTTYAATQTLTDLLRSGHDAGIAVIGLDGPGPAGIHWLSPATGREQRSRALDILRMAAVDDDPNPSHAAEFEQKRMTAQVQKVLELAPPGSQIALFSSLLDDAPVEAVETWRAAGLPVVALAPDVVPENTVSGQFEQVRRRTCLARCQATGASVVDWRRGTPLPFVIERVFAVDARIQRDRLGNSIGGGG